MTKYLLGIHRLTLLAYVKRQYKAQNEMLGFDRMAAI